MNFFDSPLGASILRGAWLAIGTGIATGLILYQQLYNVDVDPVLAGVQRSPDLVAQAAVAGAIAALAALGFRTGEGGLDQHRRNELEKAVATGDRAKARKEMHKSDVGYVVANPAAADPSVHG